MSRSVSRFPVRTITYEVCDYIDPCVSIIAEVSKIYMKSQYDLFNSIRWFERFNRGVFGTTANKDYVYLRQSSERLKEMQLDFLQELASLTYSQLFSNSRCVLEEAIRKRDDFALALKRQIEERNHLSECEVIYEKIGEYLAE